MKREQIPLCAQAGAREADAKTCFSIHVFIKAHAFHETWSGEKIVFPPAKRFRKIGMSLEDICSYSMFSLRYDYMLILTKRMSN